MPALQNSHGNATLGGHRATNNTVRFSNDKVHVPLSGVKDASTTKIVAPLCPNSGSATVDYSTSYTHSLRPGSVAASNKLQRTISSHDLPLVSAAQRASTEHTFMAPAQSNMRFEAHHTATTKQKNWLPTAAEKPCYRLEGTRSLLTTLPSRRDMLVIEGVSTGEEVVVSNTLSRRRNSDDGHASRTNAAMRLLERRLTTLQRELIISTSKATSLQAKYDRLCDSGACMLDESHERLWLTVASADTREMVMQEFMTYMQSELLHINAQQPAVDDQLGRSHEEMQPMQTLNQKNKDLLDQAEEHQLQQNRIISERDQLRDEVDGLRRKVDDMHLQFAYEKKELEIKMIEIQELLLRTQRELEEQNTKLQDKENLYAACKHFIENICQPNFRVVKDVSMTPVKRNDSQTQGFALIPLSILLQGYLMLPFAERSSLIQDYENKLHTTSNEVDDTTK